MGQRIPGLHKAVRTGDLAKIAQLLERGADPNSLWIEDTTPLHMACDEAQLEAARLLIEHGANIEARGSYFGDTCLHLAAKRGNTEMLAYLLPLFGFADPRDNRSRTPLHYASEGPGSLTSAKLLVDRGAEVDALDMELETPLMIAARYTNLPVAALLAHQGASLERCNANKETAHAIAAGVLELLRTPSRREIRSGYQAQASRVMDIMRITRGEQGF